MRVVTKRDRIRSAVKWFPEDCKGLDPETCSIEDVRASLGTNAFTVMVCDECGATGLDWLLMVGEEADVYEPNRASLCKKCITAAATLAV